MDAKATARKFVAAINAHDPKAIIALCTDDHVFTDSLGTQFTGLSQLEQGWGFYFSLFPDYRVEVQSMLAEQDLVLASGFASGTHAATGIAWRIPAGWRLRIRDGFVAEWQVYADNKPVYELLASGT
jgi:ketosteroid isomerase-like protein